MNKGDKHAREAILDGIKINRSTMSLLNVGFSKWKSKNFKLGISIMVMVMEINPPERPTAKRARVLLNHHEPHEYKGLCC